MKTNLLLLSLFGANLINAQTEINNFDPDRILGPDYPLRIIDMNADGVSDFRLRYAVEGLETFVYLETLGENEVLCHNPEVDVMGHVITSSIVTTLHYADLGVLPPLLCGVNATLPDYTLLIAEDETFWSGSNSESKNALIFYQKEGDITINLGVSASACYDYYYCRIKSPGDGNYIYGYIQIFGVFAVELGQLMHVGGTGYNPVPNATAVIDPACTVIENFEDGPQVVEEEEGGGGDNASITKFDLNGQLNIKSFNKTVVVSTNSKEVLGDLNIAIYATNGALVSMSTYSTIENEIQIDLNHLNSGLYFITIGNQQGEIVNKIVIE